jgi:hypothetical protein
MVEGKVTKGLDETATHAALFLPKKRTRRRRSILFVWCRPISA